MMMHSSRLLVFLAIVLTVISVQPQVSAQEAAGEELTAPTWLSAIDIGALEARSSALLLSGQKGGGVEGALQWTIAPGPPLETGTVVPFLVEVEGRSLLAGSEESRVPIGFYAYVMSLDGRLVAHRAQGRVFDAADRLEAMRGGGLRFIGNLTLPEGVFTLRVMVRNHLTNDYFLTWAEVRIPASEADSLGLLPPILSNRSETWVTTFQHDETPEKALAGFSGGNRFPAARPTISGGHESDLLLAITGSGREEAVGTVRFVDEAGRTVAEPALTVLPDTLPASGPVVYRRAKMEAVDLPPATYNFVVQVEAAGGQRARQASPVVVYESEDSLSWIQAAATAQPIRPRVLSPEEQITKRKTIKKEYLAALTRLASGDVLGAQRAVAAIERGVLAAGKSSLFIALRNIEQGEALRVGRKQPLSLIPIVDLHRRLHRTYHARRESRLATHAWMITADLAESAKRYQPRPITADFAEKVMIGLASDLVQSSGMSAAQTLLDRCLLMTPNHEAALLALGSAHERLGDYEEAVRTLRKLAAHHPENPEGKIRLAVNLGRNGADGAAHKIYRELMAGEPPPWITSVAYQEYARSLLRKKKTLEAIDLLREGIERRPENQRLVIQLAFALDQAGRRSEAIDLLDSLTHAKRTEVETPRYRYAEWPMVVRQAQDRYGGRDLSLLLNALARGLGLDVSGSER